MGWPKILDSIGPCISIYPRMPRVSAALISPLATSATFRSIGLNRRTRIHNDQALLILITLVYFYSTEYRVINDRFINLDGLLSLADFTLFWICPGCVIHHVIPCTFPRHERNDYSRKVDWHSILRPVLAFEKKKIVFPYPRQHCIGINNRHERGLERANLTPTIVDFQPPFHPCRPSVGQYNNRVVCAPIC